MWPVNKLSAQTTECPSANIASHRCEPRNPAPPVTSTRIVCPISQAAGRSAGQNLTQHFRFSSKGPLGNAHRTQNRTPEAVQAPWRCRSYECDGKRDAAHSRDAIAHGLSARTSQPYCGCSPHRSTGTCQESQMLNRPAAKEAQVAGVVIFQDLIHNCLLLVAAVGGNTYKQASLLERRLALEVSSLFSGK